MGIITWYVKASRTERGSGSLAKKYEKVPQKKSMVAVLYNTAMLLWQNSVSFTSDSLPKSTVSSSAVFTSAFSVQLTSVSVWSLIIIHGGNQSAINQKTSISDICHTFNNNSDQQLWNIPQMDCDDSCAGDNWERLRSSTNNYELHPHHHYIMILMIRMVILGVWPNVLSKIITRSTGVSTAALVKVRLKTQINEIVSCFHKSTDALHITHCECDENNFGFCSNKGLTFTNRWLVCISD